jgi:catechol 2,3-dioxygenase-like lactoylglutathione lyase family enzyme
MPRGKEDEARSFYGSLLGFREIEKPEALKSRGGVWFGLDDGRQVHLGVEDPFRPATKAHPCFAVDDLAAIASRLREAGYEVKYDDLLAGMKRFYCADCFGNRLEFAEAGAGLPPVT